MCKKNLQNNKTTSVDHSDDMNRAHYTYKLLNLSILLLLVNKY